MKTLALLLALGALPLLADQPLPSQLEGVGIEERLGAAVDLNLTFTGEDGYPVALRSFFGKGRPVILDLVYYSCPMLCTRVLNGQVTALQQIPWTPGNEYEVVTVSIDPTETFDLAQKKRDSYLEQFGRPAPGWHFLADRDGNAKKLAEEVGFHYRYDDATAQYAHAAGIMILTPEGRLARYLYGIRFSPRDIRFALAEASEGRSGLSVDRVLLYCFHYDPQARGYVLFAANFMRAGGVLIVLVLGIVLFRFWRVERVRSRAAGSSGPVAESAEPSPSGSWRAK
ncbi:MAG: SCO family protein [Bryobacteraceae bacterium]